MAIHLVVCPTCFDSQEVDLPPDQRATLQHTERGHVMRVKPRVMPILTPERSERPKDVMQPHIFPGQPDLNRVDLNRGD